MSQPFDEKPDPIAALLARFPPPPGNALLLEKIRAEIESSGPMSFERFMALALYDPEHGYYSTRPSTIGATGDFATSPQVHPLFGWLIAVFAYQLMADLGVEELDVVEAGGGTGAFAASFVQAARHLLGDRFAYRLIDVSPQLLELQRARIEAVWPDGRWSTDLLDSLPARPYRLVFANELLDALPVRRVVRGSEGWQELRVGIRDRRLVDVPVAIEDDELRQLVARLPEVPPGTQAEISPALVQWLRAAAATVDRGGLLLIDYGGSSAELVSEHRPTGTIRTFHQHTVGSNPYVRVGVQDMTASVDFDLVAETARSLGLTVHGPIAQAELLQRLAAAPAFERVLTAMPDDATARWRPAMEVLTDPQRLGAYQCIWLSRGLAMDGRSAAVFDAPAN